MGLDRYWYIACESRELRSARPLPRQILDMPIVLFRGQSGQAAAFRDRCLHRCGKLSKGRVNDRGHLVCPYHGWSYDTAGSVTEIPAEMPEGSTMKGLKLPSIRLREENGYVYVCLAPDGATLEPFSYRQLQKPGWRHLRLVNDFENTVENCVENFIDVPHTVFTHPGIFRKAELKPVTATVRRDGMHVHISYEGEDDNLGSFSWFLNPRKVPVVHTDEYFAPNVTHVTYQIGQTGYVITSQSVPVSQGRTRVYTTIAWRFGWLTPLARPIVRLQAQKVIDQDVDVLKDQYENIDRFGGTFVDTTADRIHRSVSQLYHAVSQENPPDLPVQEFQIRFRV